MAVFHKTGNYSISRSSNITLENIPKGCQSYQKDTCSAMFQAALFIIPRTWKQLQHPSTEEWIKKMWYIYIEYYSAGKKDQGHHEVWGKIDGNRKESHWVKNPDSEGKIHCVLTHKWILDIKEMISRVQSTTLEKPGNEEDSQRDAWITLERKEEIDDNSWCGVSFCICVALIGCWIKLFPAMAWQSKVKQ